ncbi:MAG: AIR carboxylase family protein [Candidatus Peregrinibacteria bacterium]
MSQIIIISGSDKDQPFVEKIQAACQEFGIAQEWFAASAHKQPQKVLEILKKYESEKVIFITVAGRSNALSGFCAANSSKPVLACPPFADKLDMLVNIHSTIQMPSDVPALTVLEPRNAVLACKRIFDLH